MFDWNRGGSPEGGSGARLGATRPSVAFGPGARGVQLVDESLRDGLQSASVVQPAIDRKLDLLHAMVAIGVDVASLGLPAAGGAQAEDAYLLAREIREARLPLVASAGARTVVGDVAAIARASDRAGLPIEVYAFVGSSPIRHAVEGWDLAFLRGSVVAAAEEALRHGLPFALVTEDTTRARPDHLRELFAAAVDAGATRLCLCDTTGHATPNGVGALVTFVRGELRRLGAPQVGLDWHAHNDRGLAVATALWAASHGVDRIHGTGLGVGERVGNAALELLADNLGRFGVRPAVPRARLAEYCALAARAFGWPIPRSHPIAGEGVVAGAVGPSPYRGSSAPAPPRAAPVPEDGEEPLVPIALILGGSRVRLAVPPRRTLLEALRYDLDLVGTKQGCDKGDCGACTVVLDGRAVLACLTLAVDADGSAITTVECLAGAPHLDPLVDCFDRLGGGQCGFCTPGMLMAATALLARNERPTRAEIQRAISGNLCRCTGYGPIVDAVELAARIRRGEAEGGQDLPGAECAPPPLPSNERDGRTGRGAS